MMVRAATSDDAAFIDATLADVNALGFYQRRGFDLVRLDRHAVTRSR